jgi:lipoprotein-anchoring transpeptidase ErfK/SrfK
VRALVARLADLHIHVPPTSSVFGPELADAVIAFQKAFGLERTGAVGLPTWRRLERARPPKPRFRLPALHIEVDKSRQILMVVRGGAVSAVLPVSTGATGNTPEGRHRIRWKAPATSTWLGSGILYRTLTFYGDSFAIHGWPDVPVYPASHGCVRIPVWAADWLYARSPVGETVYVYE